MMKYKLKMGIDGVIEPIYFLITSIGFVILSFIQFKKTGKSLETIYLSILAIFFTVCFIILLKFWKLILIIKMFMEIW